MNCSSTHGCDMPQVRGTELPAGDGSLGARGEMRPVCKQLGREPIPQLSNSQWSPLHFQQLRTMQGESLVSSTTHLVLSDPVFTPAHAFIQTVPFHQLSSTCPLQLIE